MRTIKTICSLLCGFLILPSTYGQLGARNTIPETVSSCYRNTTAYNRFNRQPMHINNLIAIIRKIERREPQLDMRRLTRILVNRYMFDGLQYDPNARTELQFTPRSEESMKTEQIKRLIPLQGGEMLTPGLLDNDEMCALHWMLSHSMNATIRDEDLYPSYGTGYSSSYPSSTNGNGNGYNGNGYNDNNNNYNSNTNSYNRYPPPGRKRRSLENETETSQENPQNISAPAVIAEAQPEVVDEENKTDEEKQEQSKSEEIKTPVAVGRSIPIPNIPSDLDIDPSQPKSAKQVSPIDQSKTRRPLETGVVRTNWGDLAAGRLIAGIAAALQPMTTPVNGGSPYPSGSSSYSGSGTSSNGFTGNGGSNPFGTASSNTNIYNPGTNNNNNNYNSNPFNTGNSGGGRYPGYPSSSNQYGGGRGRRRRQTSITFQPLQNLHAATLAGDVGQAAIRNGIYSNVQNFIVPTGEFNDTVCPREYILNPYAYNTAEIWQDDAAFTYMTEAEIRGGMDGLILGNRIVQLDNAGLKLSEVLDMYYSEAGIASETQVRACNRGSLFNAGIDANTVREQARSFAYLYNNASQVIPYQQIVENPNTFLGPVDDTFNRMQGVASTIGSASVCQRRQVPSPGVGGDDDTQKLVDIKNRVYAVIDHSVSINEVNDQLRFFGRLAREINVSPWGSRLGVVDGNTGQVLISPNWTDTSSILGCRVLSLPRQTKTQDYARVLTNLRTELDRLREDEIRYNYESDLGNVILFMVQGNKLPENQREEIQRLLRNYNDTYGDTRVLFASSRYQPSDFDGFVFDPNVNVVRIPSTQNLTDNADDFANEMRTRTHGRLAYNRCNANLYAPEQVNEHREAVTFFVSPDTIQYFKISPDYFYSAKNLRLRFTSDNGQVRICESRVEPLPSSRNSEWGRVTCAETSGTYVTPGSATVDVEFPYSKPCGKHGNRVNCQPIYISVTPSSASPSGQRGLDCSIEGCQSPNQVKVTFTHWDMRCNGSTRQLLSLPTALVSIFISLMAFFNNSKR